MNTLQAKFEIKLGDDTHEAHLSINAFRILTQKFGVKLHELENFMADDPLTALPAIAYCGVLNCKMRRAEKLGMDFDQFCALLLEEPESMEKLTEALGNAFGTSEESEGND